MRLRNNPDVKQLASAIPPGGEDNGGNGGTPPDAATSGNLLGLWTLYWREVWRFVKVYNQTIVAPVGRSRTSDRYTPSADTIVPIDQPIASRGPMRSA